MASSQIAQSGQLLYIHQQPACRPLLQETVPAVPDFPHPGQILVSSTLLRGPIPSPILLMQGPESSLGPREAEGSWESFRILHYMESSSTYPEPCTQGQYLTHSQPCLLSKERVLLPEVFLPQISLGPIVFLGIGACQLSVPQLLDRSPQGESRAVQVGRGDEASSATWLPNTHSAWYPWTCQLSCCLPKSMSQLSTSSTLWVIQGGLPSHTTSQASPSSTSASISQSPIHFPYWLAEGQDATL